MLKWGMGLALAVLAHDAAVAGGYQIHELTRSGFSDVWLRDINNKGQMLGSASTEAGRNVNFVFANNQFTDLPEYAEAGYLAIGRGISDAGVVVGTAQASNGAGRSKGFIFEGSGYQDVSMTDAPQTQLISISPDGRLVTGSAYSELDSTGSASELYSFILDRSTGVVTKFYANSFDSPRAFRGINDQGLLVARLHGDSALVNTVSGGVSMAGKWQGASVRLTDVSNSGTVVGNYQVYDLANDTVQNRVLLGTLGHYEALDIHGSYAQASGVNDYGFAVGVFSESPFGIGPWHAFYAISTVPEPAQGLMLGAGLFAVLLAARRQRAQA